MRISVIGGGMPTSVVERMTARSAAVGRALLARSDHLAHRLVRRAHHLLSRCHSSSRTACVYGSPDFEENSLVAAAALAETGIEGDAAGARPGGGAALSHPARHRRVPRRRGPEALRAQDC